MTELLVVAPVLLLFGLGTVQAGLLYHARTIVDYATFEAARVGAVSHAQSAPMRNALVERLAPVYGGDGSAESALQAMQRASADAANGRFFKIDILNPNPDVFADWGATNQQTGFVEIPNSHLRHRRAAPGERSSIDLQDANLLKIRVTYGYRLQVPLVGHWLAKVMKRLDPEHHRYYADGRFPLRSTAIVRMQSAARPDTNASLAVALTSVPGSGTSADDSAGNDDESGAEPMVSCDEFGFRSDLAPAAFEQLLEQQGQQQCSASTTTGLVLDPPASATDGAEGSAFDRDLTECVPAG